MRNNYSDSVKTKLFYRRSPHEYLQGNVTTNPSDPRCRQPPSVPAIQHPSLSIFQCPNLPDSQCRNVPMSQCPNLQCSQCFNVLMFEPPNMPISKCRNAPMSQLPNTASSQPLLSQPPNVPMPKCPKPNLQGPNLPVLQFLSVQFPGLPASQCSNVAAVQSPSPRV